MVGVKGSGGPVPKRSDQRRRANAPAIKVTKAAASKPTVPMKSDAEWHPVARRWFDSLETSGQSQFYTDSDWSSAYLLAESMSREFKPQPMIVGQGEHATVEFHELPPRGASLAAWLKGMSLLLVTEGDRRRVGIEVQMHVPAGEGSGGGVAWLDDARRRLNGAG